MPFFHRLDSDAEPADLLKPENQVSTPWGDADCGPCDKCRGDGRVSHRCRSCVEGAALPDCPACRGRLEWADVCPACEGTGEITRVERRGISAFPSLDGLYRYLIERDADLNDSVVVELDAALSDDVDLDADCGAVLVHPTRVVARHPIDAARVNELRDELAAG